MESGPRLEKGQAYVIVRHVKFGPSKKGGGGKLSKAVANARQEAKNGTTPLVSTAHSSSLGKEESDSEATWSVVDGNNDFDEVFDLKDDANGIRPEDTPKKMNASDLSQQRQTPDSGRTTSVPLSRQDSSIKADNRYKKFEPANRFQPQNVTDSRSRGARDTLRSEPQNRDPRRHPPTNTNFSPSTRETKRYENNSSASRNTSNETSKPGPSQHTNPDPCQSKPSFGIFSSLNANAPGKQDPPTTSYRGNREPPYTSPNAPGASENTKFTITKSEDNLNKEQKNWGVFSK